jgi:hypothetical protein
MSVLQKCRALLENRGDGSSMSREGTVRERVPVDRPIGSVGGVDGVEILPSRRRKREKTKTHTHHSLRVECKHSPAGCQLRLRTEMMVAAGVEGIRRWADESR